VTFWDDEQIAAFFEAAAETAPNYLGMFVYLLNTGCRKGEALAAERSWADFKGGFIRITPNDFWQPKDNEPREVPISDALLPWLRRALAPRPVVVQPGKEPKKIKWLFPTDEGDRFAVFPQKQFRRVVDLAARKLCADGCPGREEKAKCIRGCPTMRGAYAPPHVCLPLLEGAARHLPPSEGARPFRGKDDQALLAPLARSPRASTQRREPRPGSRRCCARSQPTMGGKWIVEATHGQDAWSDGMIAELARNRGWDRGWPLRLTLAVLDFLKDCAVELKGVEPSTSRVRF